MLYDRQCSLYIHFPQILHIFMEFLFEFHFRPFAIFCRVWYSYLLLLVTLSFFFKKTLSLHNEIFLFFILTFLYYRLIHIINKTSFAPWASHKCWMTEI